jgi:hypothetical protein
MKTLLTIAISLAFAITAVRADLANYQTTVSGQSPNNYFNFDNSLLSPSAGSGTFTAGGAAGFGSDYWGNANDAASFPATTDYLTGSAGILSDGTTTAVGSLSMLFYVPSSIPTTGYYFSDGDASPLFAFSFGSSALSLKLANKTFTGLPAVTANTWYYLALSYDLNGTATGVNGVNWYIGAIGGTLSTGFFQKGGSGNINSTTTLGNGGTFALGNKESNLAGVAGGAIDELATWTTALSSSQINSQFSALTVSVPEPSTCAVLGLGGLLVLWKRRAFRRD